MDGKFLRFALIVGLMALLGFAVQPVATRLLLSETAPRAVAARGNLSEAERSTIELFEQVSPSVVQVVGRQRDGEPSEGDEGVQSGTGFIWDGAGNIVTNDHVVSGVAQRRSVFRASALRNKTPV
jgi:2-alkenal reductase